MEGGCKNEHERLCYIRYHANPTTWARVRGLLLKMRETKDPRELDELAARVKVAGGETQYRIKKRPRALVCVSPAAGRESTHARSSVVPPRPPPHGAPLRRQDDEWRSRRPAAKRRGEGPSSSDRRPYQRGGCSDRERPSHPLARGWERETWPRQAQASRFDAREAHWQAGECSAPRVAPVTQHDQLMLLEQLRQLCNHNRPN